MKRVNTLYRVSTKKQVDKTVDDIPMQKIACREFCDRQSDWVITKEHEEKGISGFKVSANNRDAIQDLKEAALKREFDVLLVFLFDRIGRIEDETPFVVEWFVRNGIEVWSVKEGQQRFENHIDKLMNYLRFWQAAGESEKTSIRIQERKSQLTIEGHYTGGSVPFGFELADKGRKNKKGEPVKDYVKSAEETVALQMMFEKTVIDGYGSHRLAGLLNSMGYRTHKGREFRSNYVIRILRNPIACGIVKSGKAQSDIIPDLQTISTELFDAVQSILDQRQKKNEEKRQIAYTTKGKAMLSGNIYCAHCGSRLITIRYQDRYKRKDGSFYGLDQIKYSCYHKSRKLCECDGQSTYVAERVDEIVSSIMRRIFSNVGGAPEEEKLNDLLQRQMTAKRTIQKKLEIELEKNKKQLETLQLEIGKSLTGDSFYSPQDLSQAIDTVREKILADETQIRDIQDEVAQQKMAVQNLSNQYKQFKSWAEVFDTATLEQKKMIACQLFKSITVGRDYKISVELNMTYQQFCSEWNTGSPVMDIAG